MTNFIKEYLQYAKKIISLVENTPDCHIFTHTSEGRIELINETQRLEEIQRLNEIKELEKELQLLKETKSLEGILKLFKRIKDSEKIERLEEKLKLLKETKRLDDIKRLDEIKYLDKKIEFLKEINLLTTIQRYEKIESFEKLKRLNERLEILKAIECLEENLLTQISDEEQNRLWRIIQPLYSTLTQLSRDQEDFEPGKIALKNRIDNIKKAMKSIDDKQVEEFTKAIKNALELCDYSMDRGINRWDIDRLEGPLMTIETYFMDELSIDINAEIDPPLNSINSLRILAKNFITQLSPTKIYPELTSEEDQDSVKALDGTPEATYLPGMTIYDVPQDGNCFYSAIAANLGLTATTVREMAIQHIMHRHEYYETILPIPVDTFVAENSPLGIWADHEMIQIIANYFNLNIIISEEGTLREYPRITPITGINLHTQAIYLIYTGTHYLAVLPNDHPALQADQVQNFTSEEELYFNPEDIPLGLPPTVGLVYDSNVFAS